MIYQIVTTVLIFAGLGWHFYQWKRFLSGSLNDVRPIIGMMVYGVLITIHPGLAFIALGVESLVLDVAMTRRNKAQKGNG